MQPEEAVRLQSDTTLVLRPAGRVVEEFSTTPFDRGSGERQAGQDGQDHHPHGSADEHIQILGDQANRLSQNAMLENLGSTPDYYLKASAPSSMGASRNIFLSVR